MDPQTIAALCLALAVVLVMARIAGAIARKLNQPRVLGELIAGVVIGPTVLNLADWNVFHHAPIEAPISQFAEIGVLLLMFLVGLEINIRELAKVRNVALASGIIGALLPVVVTVPTVVLFGMTANAAVFAGVALAATSVSISAQVLLELGFLQSKEGNALLAAALVDDVLAVLLISIAVALTAAGGQGEGAAGDVVGVLMRMIVFLAVSSVVSWFGIPRLMVWIAARRSLSQSYGGAIFALAIMLVFAWAAESIGGVATITGSFIAGVGFSRVRSDIRHVVEDAARNLAYAFLVPIFFVDVGLRTNLRLLPLSAFPLAAALLVGAVLSKVGGSALGARLGGFNRQEAVRIGVCMIARGEVGLIVTAIGVNAGVFAAGDPLYGSLFLVILLTTLLTPILVRQVFPKRPATA